MYHYVCLFVSKESSVVKRCSLLLFNKCELFGYRIVICLRASLMMYYKDDVGAPGCRDDSPFLLGVSFRR